ncbi:MAG: murein L,D-transpeptidase catalytic domain family protein [Bacteroidales bacterium]
MMQVNLGKQLPFWGFILALSFFPITQVKGSILSHGSSKGFEHEVNTLYDELSIANNDSLPSFEVFSFALRGYQMLYSDSAGIEKNILTIIDFSKPSKEKRLWVIDIETGKVLFHDLVAHGQASGSQFATRFSNVPNTHMSSLGFYITGKTYQGKHGLSLYLDGVEEGFNHNARKRYIVMHGASYVCPAFVKKYGRLGRSFGCPAISKEISKDVINTIAGGSCLFIYYPDKTYLESSSYL